MEAEVHSGGFWKREAGTWTRVVAGEEGRHFDYILDVEPKDASPDMLIHVGRGHRAPENLTMTKNTDFPELIRSEKSQNEQTKQ